MNDIVKAPLVAGNLVSAIVPTTLEQVWRESQIIADAGWLPRDYTKPVKGADGKWIDPTLDQIAAKVCVAIMHGLEIGLKPMQAVQMIAIINGRPCLPSNTALALIHGSGLLENIEEKVEGEGELMVAVCKVKRKGIKSIFEQTFSVADAKLAGLWSPEPQVKRRGKNNEWYVADNDSPWYRYPKRMLQHRARIVLRDSHGDVLSGIHILETMDAETHEEIDTAPARGSRKQPAAPVATETPAAPVIEHKPQLGAGGGSDDRVLIWGSEEPIGTQKTIPVGTGGSETKKPLPPLVQRQKPAPQYDPDADTGEPPPRQLQRKNYKNPHNISDNNWGDAAELVKDPLDIPPEFDRRLKQAPLGTVETEWLEKLRDAFDQAEDLTALSDHHSTLMMPHEGKVSNEAWTIAQDLKDKAIKRINGQDI